MPKENNFQHAKYSRSDPGDRVRYLTLETGAPPQTQAWQEAMARLGESFQKAKVQGILLVQGTHLGTDLFGIQRLDEAGGLKRGYSRGIPGIESLLASLRSQNTTPPTHDTSPDTYENTPQDKSRLDTVLGDTANFSEEYIQLFQQGINQTLTSPIPVSRFLWSSRHHHLGRMEGALALFHQVHDLTNTLSLTPDDRLLILAHGHAGQVLALLSNLIAPGESPTRSMIFETLAAFYQEDSSPSLFLDILVELDRYLSAPEVNTRPRLDVVTLGTPIRSGWDRDGVDELLHVVNHRPIRSDGKKWLAKMELPQVAWEMGMALGGDYVQQFAVAGTDAIPALPREQEVNRVLQEFLEPYDGFERWLECARRATRCPNDGQCLLIDYQDASEGETPTHLFGHACYTRMEAMLFQTSHIVKSAYSGSPQPL